MINQNYKYLIKGIDDAEAIALEFLHNGYSVELYPEGEKDVYTLWVKQVRQTGGGGGVFYNLQKAEKSGVCQFWGSGSGGCGIMPKGCE